MRIFIFIGPEYWGCDDDNSINGSFVLHFRESTDYIWWGNYTNSIRKFNFDFEYLFFLLKHSAGICKN